MNEETSKEDRLTLELLDVIGKQSDLSQRHLARHLGVALGLANSYLKRCVRKGFVKIRQAPANRYLYYLTPKGFAEKSRLTGDYLRYSFAFYKRASDSCAKVFDNCVDQGWRKVFFCGISDLAEIAALRATEMQIEVVGIYDLTAKLKQFINLPVYPVINAAPSYDAVVLTAIENAPAVYRNLITQVEAQRILIPDILGIERP